MNRSSLITNLCFFSSRSRASTTNLSRVVVYEEEDVGWPHSVYEYGSGLHPKLFKQRGQYYSNSYGLMYLDEQALASYC